MEYIAHRINTLNELTQLPNNYGVELDLRDTPDGRIHISHDPFQEGEDFEKYAAAYNHGTMILNIKSERIEERVLEVVKANKIPNYFFLDSSFPMINLLSKGGEDNVALRFSEFEGLDTIRTMKGKVKWVWVDCFTKLPIDSKNYKELKELDYKLCLVSPELQGRPDDIKPYKDYLSKEGVTFDAICTKVYNIPLWEA